MANHKSAKKRARQNDVRNVFNRSYLASVRTAVKNFRAAAAKKDADNLQPLLQSAQSKLMKAVSKGVIKKNTAARTISRLTLQMRSVTSK